MPSGTALLQSPGWNEGKARYETLGKPRQKWVELLQERHFRREYLSLGVPPLIGAQDMLIDYKPRACALGYAGVSPLQGSFTSFQSLYYFDTLALVLCNGFHEVKKKYLPLHRASLKVYPL